MKRIKNFLAPILFLIALSAAVFARLPSTPQQAVTLSKGVEPVPQPQPKPKAGVEPVPPCGFSICAH